MTKQRAFLCTVVVLLGLAAGSRSLVAAPVASPTGGHVPIAQEDEDQGEIEQGREADRQIEAQFGFYQDEELLAYVDRIGQELAAVSERPTLPWTFRVLDSPVVNAFALPGGFIYVTRGLLAHMNSEAELAGVLGHEIGHVTGRHSRARQVRSGLAMLGMIIGGMVSDTFREIALDTGLAQNVSGLFLLKYSRDQELDADQRGIGYATSAGYDPRGIGEFFDTLQSLEQQSDRRNVPGWLSTHPQVDDRIERSAVWVSESLADTGARPEDLIRGRDAHILAVDGLVFGENPREGYFRGEQFIHPDLRFELRFPAGWQVQNGRQAVTAVDPRERAMIQLTLAPLPEGTTASEYVEEYLRGVNARVEDSERASVNGLESLQVLFSAQGERSNYAVLGQWTLHDGLLYQLLGITSPRSWRDYRETFRACQESFEDLTDERALGVVPARVEVLRNPQRMQLFGFIEAHPEISVPPVTIAIINHLELDDMLEEDALVKMVTGGLEADAFERPLYPPSGNRGASKLSYDETASVSMTSPGVGGDHES
jgi:predicted Zn-dependent protease